MVETNYRELERKRTLQHYLTMFVRHWNGESVKEIAKSLKMEARSVQRDLEFIQKTYGDAGAKPKTSKFAGMGEWKIETTCSACGAQIASGKDRLVIAALELTSEYDDFITEYRRNGVIREQGGGGIADVVGRHQLRHYCTQCSVKEPEFLISNPAFGESKIKPETAPATSQAPQDGPGVPEAVKIDLAAGDDRSFNETFPERARSTDAMARSTDMAAIGTRSGFGGDSLRVDAKSGEAVQRARVLEYLNDHRSRSKMLPEVREAVRMWGEGARQDQVARKLAKDQSTVSRWIKTALKLASAPR
jgi:hypothetical protein